MAHGSPAGVLVAVLFVLTGAWSVVRAVTAGSAHDLAHHLAHAVMSGVMALMPFSSYAEVPTALQIVAFSAAALWYVYLILFAREASVPDGTEDPAPMAHDHHRHPVTLGYHAVMMLAMVWMAVAAAPMVPRTAAAMAGMSMPSDPAAGSWSSGPMSMTGQQPWALVISRGCGVAFAAAALVFLGVLLRRLALVPRLHAGLLPMVGDLGATVLMAGATSLAFLAVMA